MSETAPPTTEPTLTERDMLGAMEVLSTTSDEAAVLVVLTDEEIMALDGASSLELLGSPYLSQEAIETESAAASALRSLVARGLVRPGSEGREEEGEVVTGSGDPARRPVQLDRRLAGVIALRRIPEAMVTAQRTLAGGTTTLAHYFFPREGVLEEYVTIDGFHHFAVPALPSVAERLRAFVDPFEAAGEDGEPVAMSLQDAVASLEGEDTRSLSVVTTIAEGQGRRATVSADSGSVRVLDNGPLEQEAEPTDEVHVSAVSSERLREVLDLMLPREVEDPSAADGEG
ncbi:hypothetical protein ACH0CV_10895 [Brachybacterium paraconglomeratum]|uniref:hypothetical protein n=1 Tax=Brachybacterium paraconglomeratum TaxID=173362 RepID=UPI00387A6CC1